MTRLRIVILANSGGVLNGPDQVFVLFPQAGTVTGDGALDHPPLPHRDPRAWRHCHKTDPKPDQGEDARTHILRRKDRNEKILDYLIFIVFWCG